MKNIFNQKGFSLVEVMVAIGIAGGLSLAVMQLTENASNVENQSITSADTREILSEIRTILENENHCRLSLQEPNGDPLRFFKVDVDDPNADGGHPVELWLGNAAGTARSTKKFGDDTIFGKAKISSIRLFMNNQIGSNYPEGGNSDLGILRVKIAKGGKAKSEVQKDFLINLDFVTDSFGKTTVKGCARTSSKAVCDAIGMSYDSGTQKCVTTMDVCDGWHTIANADGWSGWRSKTCDRLAGGYIQSIQVMSTREGSGDKDWTGMRVKCCYSTRLASSSCSGTINVADENWWTGTREGFCTAQPKGYLRKIDLSQQRNGSGDRDMNGMRIQCCYPN